MREYILLIFYFIVTCIMTSVTFKTNSTCLSCDEMINHVYECKCGDYYGYCTSPDCSWFVCSGCKKHHKKEELNEKRTLRPCRTDTGTEKERDALNRLLGKNWMEEYKE